MTTATIDQYQIHAALDSGDPAQIKVILTMVERHTRADEKYAPAWSFLFDAYHAAKGSTPQQRMEAALTAIKHIPYELDNRLKPPALEVAAAQKWSAIIAQYATPQQQIDAINYVICHPAHQNASVQYRESLRDPIARVWLAIAKHPDPAFTVEQRLDALREAGEYVSDSASGQQLSQEFFDISQDSRLSPDQKITASAAALRHICSKQIEIDATQHLLKLSDNTELSLDRRLEAASCAISPSGIDNELNRNAVSKWIDLVEQLPTLEEKSQALASQIKYLDGGSSAVEIKLVAQWMSLLPQCTDTRQRFFVLRNASRGNLTTSFFRTALVEQWAGLLGDENLTPRQKLFAARFIMRHSAAISTNATARETIATMLPEATKLAEMLQRQLAGK